MERPYNLPVLTIPFIFTILSLFLVNSNFEYIYWCILAIGFLSVGLSHGALDHLTTNKIGSKKQLLYFVAGYLLKSAILGLVWLFLPDLALLVFITYSAWHFGQTDFKEWRFEEGLQSLLWGIVVLMTILFFHIEELTWILKQIPNLQATQLLIKITDVQVRSIQVFIIAVGLLLAVLNKSKYILYTLFYLLLSSFLPLLVSFGIYFIGQHSVQGWRHLTIGLKECSYKLWLKSLPFSIGGALLILYFSFFSNYNHASMFFIILSCLSVPHIFSMHRFYSKPTLS